MNLSSLSPGGFDRPDESYAYETYEHQLSLYLPSRVALVLARP